MIKESNIMKHEPLLLKDLNVDNTVDKGNLEL
jgi:hypothetical protein